MNWNKNEYTYEEFARMREEALRQLSEMAGQRLRGTGAEKKAAPPPTRVPGPKPAPAKVSQPPAPQEPLPVSPRIQPAAEPEEAAGFQLSGPDSPPDEAVPKMVSPSKAPPAAEPRAAAPSPEPEPSALFAAEDEKLLEALSGFPSDPGPAPSGEPVRPGQGPDWGGPEEPIAFPPSKGREPQDFFDHIPRNPVFFHPDQFVRAQDEEDYLPEMEFPKKK
ncbi:MAG: hypothetical protein PHD67_03655 [Oscillospiraceae bacterium]|nr:hypothetical protein [Oscillospiraceae bacterium]